MITCYVCNKPITDPEFQKYEPQDNGPAYFGQIRKIDDGLRPKYWLPKNGQKLFFCQAECASKWHDEELKGTNAVSPV